MFLIFFLPIVLFAHPKGGTIIQGAASFAHPAQNVLEIRADDQTVLHWEEFSIAEGERARFILPHSDAAILNRVTGAETSHIYGILEGNGKVLLLNPNGLIIGKSGVVDAFAFSATACKIENWGKVAARSKIHLVGDGDVLLDGSVDLSDGGAFYAEGERISIPGSLVLSSSADFFFKAREEMAISGILGNFQAGNMTIEAGSVRLQSSPASSSQIFAQGGKIEISAEELVVASEGTPAEIIALNGTVSFDLKGSLKVLGGAGSEADAFAKICGETIRIAAGGNLLLQGGGGARCISEICAQEALEAKIGGDLKIEGGGCRDRSYASLAGGSIRLEVEGCAQLSNGCGSSVQISSRRGSLFLSCGSLVLMGREWNGPARIKAKEGISLASRQKIVSEYGEILAKEGKVSIQASEIRLDNCKLSGQGILWLEGGLHLIRSTLDFSPILRGQL